MCGSVRLGEEGTGQFLQACRPIYGQSLGQGQENPTSSSDLTVSDEGGGNMDVQGCRCGPPRLQVWESKARKPRTFMPSPHCASVFVLLFAHARTALHYSQPLPLPPHAGLLTPVVPPPSCNARLHLPA
eukprot:364101-Chlamydomonas_euryale.AAC.1